MTPKGLLTAIGSYVGRSGLATVGVDLHLNLLPATPVNCTAILLHGGPVVGRSPLRHKSIQIVHRNSDRAAGLTTVGSLHVMFARVMGALDGEYRVSMIADHEPGMYVVDENGYFCYNLNYTVNIVE